MGSLQALALEPDPGLSVVQFAVSALTGAANDPAEQGGLSHLMARMMRRTAGGRARLENERRLDLLGASVGVEVLHDSISVSGSCLVSSLPQVAEFLADMLEPGFERNELERLKRDCAAERADSRDDDEYLVQRAFHVGLFGSHAYARSLAGAPDSLERIDAASLRAALRRHFRRGNVAIALAGPLTRAQAVAFAAPIEERLAPEEPASVNPLCDPLGALGKRLWLVEKPERAQIQVVMGCLTAHPRDDGFAALMLADTVYGGTFSARLTRQVRSERGWSYTASSGLEYERYRQSWSQWTQPSAEVAADCVRLQLDLVNEFVQQGVEEPELCWAKQHLAHRDAFRRDTAAKRAGLRLEPYLLGTPVDFDATLLSAVASTTQAQVNAAIARWWSLSRWGVAVVCSPESAAELAGCAEWDVVESKPFGLVD